MDFGPDPSMPDLAEPDEVRRKEQRVERRATYRVQMNASFSFDDAAAMAPYLGRLGVSHLYLSPVLQAAAGSTHGYDVVDPTRVNSELGGDEAHRRLQEALAEANLGQLLDVVPNHMAITGRDNLWWWDVLENGPSSIYATYFDVDWDPPESKLRNTVLLPILGDHYGRALEAGDLQLKRDRGSFVITYFEHEVPISPHSLDELLEASAHRLAKSNLGSGSGPAAGSDGPGTQIPVVDEAVNELESIANAFGRLPPSSSTDTESVRERHRDKEVFRSRLARLCEEHPQVATAVDAELAAINSDVDRLDDLIGRQNYRLAWWRTATEELDYRRFFDVTTLAAIRAEDDAVFADSHRLVIEWLRKGVIDGIRIDHIDGLRDPAEYLKRLCEAAPDAWVLVEKILEGDEKIPENWPIDGTTGYEWLNLVGGLLVDPDGAAPTLKAYREFTKQTSEWNTIEYEAKRLVMADVLSADLNRLSALLVDICERHRRQRDFSRRELRDTLTELIAAYSVYRTYVVGASVTTSDVETVERAIRIAAMRRPELDWELLGFVRDVLLMRVTGTDEDELAMRFQQVSGPVMAKSVEDTAFYRYLPLSSLNEVGGDPGCFGVMVEAFHAQCATSHARWPSGLLSTSTHDTKRSEDVRARISLLSEIPDQWADTARRWSSMLEEYRFAELPDANTEWLIYQSLFGAWPINAERLVAYMQKATKEAKVHTSWVDPSDLYDNSVRRFVEGIFEEQALLADVEQVVSGLCRPGWSNSLTQKLLTLTAPGVPDLYQGSELWDFSLVDPDNRRSVDYGLRAELLARAEGGTSPGEAWAAESGDGLTKLMVVARVLELRRRHPEWFGSGHAGAYRALAAGGAQAHHLVGFSRGARVISLGTRLPLRLASGGGWGETVIELPAGRWRNHLGFDVESDSSWSGSVKVGELLSAMPVALLAQEEI